MNLHTAAGNFGVGLTNGTIWASHNWVNEYKTVADTATGVWGGKLPIDVTKVAVSKSDLRSTADITIDFKLPTTTGEVTKDSDYVAV